MVEEEGIEARPLQREGGSRSRRSQKRGLVVLGLISRPINWVKMLSDELHWSFVVGVVVVYGINQGLGFGLSRVSTQYYMKDEQKVQPSQAQILVGIIHIPWILKPLWGLLSDVVPVFGYRRRPYFVLAGFLGIVSMLVLSMQKNLHLAFALVCLVAGSAGIAFADVAIDACVTQNSISHPHLAGDMQSLCGMSTSIGAFVGFSLSGVFVHLVGPTGVYGLLSVPAGLVVLVGLLLRESHIRNSAHRKVRDKFAEAGRTMWATLKCRDVWRSCLYMYLSIALGLHIHEGMFYWYTDAKDGPCFSQEVVGSIFSLGAAGSLLGVVLYQNLLKNHPFRDLLFWTQLLHGLSGLLDLVLLWRINLKFGVPDYFFVVLDEALSRLISRIKWMPFLVLSSKLCPAGIEGTFFALIMSIDHVGMLSSAWGGGLLLHFLKVTRTQFENLWVAILVRSVLRIVPLAFLFLIPRTDPSLSVLPAEMLKAKKGDDILGQENLEMASLISTS